MTPSDCSSTRPETRRSRTVRRALAIVAAGVWLLGSARNANAFCRSRTCGRDCTTDEFTCPIEGLPLFWKGRCASYSLQRDDLPTVSHDELRAASDAAFRAWQEVECFSRGAVPAMAVTNPFGDTACGRVEYNSGQANANVIVLRDTWDAEGANTVLGLTTVAYQKRTGEILDADIEINGLMPITGGRPGPGQYDLQSILTHEVGHFLGLTHSSVGLADRCHDGATMCPTYEPGSEDFRTLSNDDIEGICTVYPPDRDAPVCEAAPLRGFSAECALDPMTGGSCAMRVPGGSSQARAFSFAIAALGLAIRRLRRTSAIKS